MTVVVRMIDALSARDRGLYSRWALHEGSAQAVRRCWIGVTHAGGAAATITAAVVPIALQLRGGRASWLAAGSLVLSHLVVQAIKRTVGRPRPEAPAGIAAPDRFSFPSGHATASMAVALCYAVAVPTIALPLVGFGLLVGWSRVVLGVHYPGDVVAGQLIAVLTVLALRPLA
ncbi:MAG TPA: phosphatase PAP2 family protein [Gemmatimonadales bacterium]|nr:phosphatase PAP2 family protein [Gemmatimonadales bacterium]